MEILFVRNYRYELSKVLASDSETAAIHGIRRDFQKDQIRMYYVALVNYALLEFAAIRQFRPVFVWLS
jgi:hypothetical protein